MANNYRLFSAALVIGDAEKPWCEAKLAELRSMSNAHPGDEIDHEIEVDQYDSCADFNFEFEVNNSEPRIWFYSEESGNTNHVAEFVQMYLAHFHPDKCWYMSWADTCSKPRLDEFSGGAVFVTATKIKWMEAQRWASEQTEAFIKAQN